MKTNVTDEIKRFFSPEFLNRIDGTVVFHALSREEVHEIVDLEMKSVAAGLLEKGVSLEVTEKAKEWLGQKGYDPYMGARPLRRLIQDKVEDKLSDAILEGRFSPGDKAIIDIEDDEVAVQVDSVPIETT